jgi:hypothetical protein
MKVSTFQQQLNMFRIDVESASQCFSAYISIHRTASSNKIVRARLNDTILLWNTILGSLLSSTFVSLGRIFDEDSPHNINKLLSLIKNNPDIFTKQSLRLRRELETNAATEWIDNFISKAYEPTKEDIRSIRKGVNAWRIIFRDKYKDIRHKIYAHKEVSEPDDISELFAKTNINELIGILRYLWNLHNQLWNLYHNGSKLQSENSSAKFRPYDQISDEVEKFLMALPNQHNKSQE